MQLKIKIYFVLIVLSLYPAAAFAAEETVSVLSVSGSVEYRINKEGEWKNADKGTLIADGGSIRTGKASRAELLFKNGSTVWLKESTNLDIQIKSIKERLVQMNSGSIKVRVPHISFKEKFILRTPMSLAAVRGTVFTMDAEENGNLDNLNVLFGEVKLDFTSQDKSVSIPQGTGYMKGDVVLLTPEIEAAGMEDWSPATPDSERRALLVENVQKRNEIRVFAQQAAATEKEVGAVREQAKEEDFAAGRTLVDVHGNIVRVDQKLDRPDNKTLQVLNVVKRTNYSSGGLRKWAYNGPANSRIDALIAKVEFNKALPDQINALPGFFSANEETVKVDRATLILANMGDNNNIFTISFFGKRNTSANTDDIESDLYVGTLNGRNNLFNLRLDDNNNVTGLTHFKEDLTIKSVDSGDSVNGELYHWDAKRWYDVVTPTNKMWVAFESFIINNDGKVRNVSDFTNAVTDFESLLKNTAGEVAVFIKQDVSNAPGSADATTWNPGSKNIDLVITPDLALSILKSLATSGDTLKTTY